MDKALQYRDRVYDTDFQLHGTVVSLGACEHGYYDVEYDENPQGIRYASVHVSELEVRDHVQI